MYSIVTSYGLDDRGIVVPFVAGQEVICSKASRRDQVPTQPPIQWVSEGKVNGA
jgi:hypothetical protein